MFYEEQDESEEQYLKDSEARQKNLKMAHVMLDIAQNASIRGMRVDGEDRFSVYDFMNYVYVEKTQNLRTPTAHLLVFHKVLTSRQMFVQIVPNIKFTGKGQKPTPCMTVWHILVLQLVPGTV